MTLPEPLREKLACPRCHRGLEYIEADDRLICRTCRLKYKIVDEIPVLIVDEAEELD